MPQGQQRAFAGKPEVDGHRHGRVPRHIREHQILDAAERAFSELGFDGTSIEEVCRRAGIKRPLIYTYFGGKDGLYLACYRRAREELEQRLGDAAAQLDPARADGFKRAVDALTETYFSFLGESTGRWDMLYGPGAATAGPIGREIADLRFGTVDLIAALIAQYAGPELTLVERMAFAHAISGTSEQMARYWRRSPEVDIDELADRCASFIWGGLRQVERR